MDVLSIAFIGIIIYSIYKFFHNNGGGGSSSGGGDSSVFTGNPHIFSDQNHNPIVSFLEIIELFFFVKCR